MSRTRKLQQKTQQEQPLLPTPDGLLNVEGAAKWLAISQAKLYELMRDETDFPVIRFPGKLICFDPNSLYQWALKKQKIS